MNLQKIMIVDDEPLNVTILETLLEDSYTLLSCFNGQQCLDQVESFAPDLILMDVNMPGIDGIKTCRRLKEQPMTQEIPVIFVSALTRPEDRLAGYQAGGEDYIPKPFEEAELRTKIELALANKLRIEEFKRNSQDAMQAAMTAITNAGEIGTVLQFFRDSFMIRTYPELAQRLTHAVRDYGLSCATLISLPDKRQFRCTTSGAVKPLMFQALETLRDKDRIFDFDYRTAFNFTNISFLILNMPTHNMDYYGRLKDHLALLGEGAQAAINAILIDESLQKQSEERQKAVETLTQTMTLFEQRQREIQFTSSNIMHTMQSEIETLFNRLGLTDQQESFINRTIETASHDLESLHDIQAALGKHLELIIKRLQPKSA